MDIYNDQNQDIFMGNSADVNELVKAMSAGSQTGVDLNGQETSGSALKMESLESMVNIITNRDSHIKLWRTIPKSKAKSNIEQFNQLVDYGGNTGIFNNEGETPQFTDSIYRRESIKLAYMGVSGEVTHPFQLVELAGQRDALAAEVKNKTSYLLREMDKQMPIADSTMVSNQYDGIFRQHYVSVTSDSSLAGTPTLDAYQNDSVVVDARGKILSDGFVESATNAIMQDNFGYASQIIAKPEVFSDYVKQFYGYKQVMVNNPTQATTGATMGQDVQSIQTGAGLVNVNRDIFFDWKPTRDYNATATNTKAPAAPTAGGTPVAAITDTSNQFNSTFAGDYYYAVAAKNRYGESAMTLLNADATTALAVASTESADLQFTATAGAYTPESYVIYRTEAVSTGDATNNKFYPIFNVSAAQVTEGYDGAAAGKVRDRNRSIANTSSAMIYDIDPMVWEYKQLMPISRMDLAITAPARRFMVLHYGAPVLKAGKKIARITNIGKITS